VSRPARFRGNSGLARTLLRLRGLLILETACSTEDRFSMNWVFNGRQYVYWSGTNTWFFTLRVLDHILRYMKFKPIDCVYGQFREDATRVAVIAVPDPTPLKSEPNGFCPTMDRLSRGRRI
jgi:hypothetical protein